MLQTQPMIGLLAQNEILIGQNSFLFSALESTSGGALEEEFLRFQHRSQPQTFHLKDLLSELDSTAAGSSASAAWKSPL